MLNYVKDLTKHSIIYSSSNLLTKAVGVFLIPIYVRFLSPEEYGIISLLAPFGFLILTIFDFGFKSTLTRFFFDQPDKSTAQKRILGNIVVINVIIIVLGLLVLFLLGETVFSALIGNVAFYPFVALTIGISATQVLFELQLAVFRSRNQSLQFGIYSFTRFLLIVVLTIILVAGFKLGAQGKLWAEFSVTAVYMLIAIYLLRHDIIINLDFSIAKSIIKYTLPLLPHVLFGALMGLIGKYFINRYLGLEATGIFNIAFLLSSIMSIIVMSINQVWSPYFFKLASENEEEANKIFTKLSTYYFSFVAFIGLLITLFSREFVLLLATPQYASCIEIIPVLTLAAFISGLYFTVSSKVFFVKSAIKIIPITTFLGLIITTVLNWLLIPSYGMMGSAWATVGANLAMLIATYLYSQKFFYMKYEYGRLLKASLSIVVTFLLFIYIQKEIHAPVLLIALKSILCILYFLFLFLFRFLNMSEINWLKKFYNSIKNPQKLSI